MILRLAALCSVLVSGCLCQEAHRQQSGDDTSNSQPDSIVSNAPKFAASIEGDPGAIENTIVVKNATELPVDLDVTFGPLSPIAIAPLDGKMGPLGPDDPKLFCRCICMPNTRCIDCEPPNHKKVTLAPGAEHTMDWNGLMGRYRQNDDRSDLCLHPFEPLAGTYFFRACAMGYDFCGVTKVKFPTSDPVIIELLAVDRAKISCAGFPQRELSRVVNMALARLELRGQGPKGIGVCEPTTAKCVDTWDQEKHEAAINTPCDIMVTPTNAGTEVRVNVKGERYAIFFDVDGVGVYKVNTIFDSPGGKRQ